MKKVSYGGVVRTVADERVNEFLDKGYVLVEETEKPAHKPAQKKTAPKAKKKK